MQNLSPLISTLVCCVDAHHIEVAELVLLSDESIVPGDVLGTVKVAFALGKRNGSIVILVDDGGILVDANLVEDVARSEPPHLELESLTPESRESG